MLFLSQHYSSKSLSYFNKWKLFPSSCSDKTKQNKKTHKKPQSKQNKRTKPKTMQLSFIPQIFFKISLLSLQEILLALLSKYTDNWSLSCPFHHDHHSSTCPRYCFHHPTHLPASTLLLWSTLNTAVRIYFLNISEIMPFSESSSGLSFLPE